MDAGGKGNVSQEQIKAETSFLLNNNESELCAKEGVLGRSQHYNTGFPLYDFMGNNAALPIYNYVYVCVCVPCRCSLEVSEVCV